MQNDPQVIHEALNNIAKLNEDQAYLFNTIQQAVENPAAVAHQYFLLRVELVAGKLSLTL